jgi:hypothetical protein
MNWLGDYPEDFTTVAIYFTTHDVTGAPVAPLTGYEAADVTIYKNGSATQKTSTNGVTMTSPFDSITGLHCVVIDTSNDTGDSGFWTTGGGGVYSVILNPDTETVAGQTTLKVIGTFGIRLANIAGDVWNAARSSYVTAGSFGVSAQIIRDGTAQAGAAGTITLDGSASATDSFYNGSVISIYSGTGANQSPRTISAYVGSTKVATVKPNWTTNPDVTSKFLILPQDPAITGSDNRVLVSADVHTSGETVAAVTGAVGSVTGAVGSVTGLTASDVGTIKTKTDFLPSATAGAAGGVFIAGTNAATTITTALTTTFTGNLSGSVGSVTGLTASNLDATISSRMATYSQPTGFLAATFPTGTVASTTNITAGTITTVTNLTNAPTAGDLTATMKTSVTTAATAATPTAAAVTGNVGGNVVGSVGSVTGLTASNLDTTVSSRLASASYTAPPSANSNADALLDRTDGVETGVTPRGLWRLLGAVMAGKVSGAGTGTETFRNTVADSKDRIVATVDTSGNRTAITTDQT